MSINQIPYGRGRLHFILPEGINPTIIEPCNVPSHKDPLGLATRVINNPIGKFDWDEYSSASSASIAVCDKTRFVPYGVLLPPLLTRIMELGISEDSIKIIIGTGLHPTITSSEFTQFLPKEIVARYCVLCHKADERKNLKYLGETSFGTPIRINRDYIQSDLRISVGVIEPHQFIGYSGGVKTASIGLAGRKTIHSNHKMMSSPNAAIGRFYNNPARKDVEEIGKTIEVNFALNGILNNKSKVVNVLFGEPIEVMKEGIRSAAKIFSIKVESPYDLIIASPGGYPKDINLYQSQKAFAHASLAVKEGGTVILAAACSEGSGSESYEKWMKGMRSHQDVISRFNKEGFRIGPHKAMQISKDIQKAHLLLVSEMTPESVRNLLLQPFATLEEALSFAIQQLPKQAKIGIMPRASSTMPIFG